MRKTFQYQPFVILGTARTGSTMLWSYLNSHHDILCLRGVYGSTDKINFGKFYGELPEEFQSTQLIKHRNERPVEFLENYVWKGYSKPYMAVGFKYFYDHNRHLSDKNGLIRYFKANTSIKFIHIKRDNLLGTLFSYKRALVQQQWTKANTDFKTTISVQECSEYFKHIQENQKRFNKFFPNRTLQINYDHLINAIVPTLQDILEFIGVDNITLTTETNKNKEVKLSECIVNYIELQNHFSKSEYAAYFNE